MWILDPVANEGLYNLQDPPAQNSRTHSKKCIMKGTGGMLLAFTGCRQGWGFLRRQRLAPCRHVQPVEPQWVRWVRRLDSEVKRQRASVWDVQGGWRGKSRPSPQGNTCRLRREHLCARDQLTPKCALHQNGNQAVPDRWEFHVREL